VIELFIIFLGLSFGSFANVLIHRLPRHENFMSDRSRCPSCKKQIAFYDNIPLLSWLILRGKCRSCASPISIRYPMVEAVTGALFLLAYLRFGFSAFTPVAMLALLILLVLALIDLETMYVPDGLVLTGILIALIPLLLDRSLFLPHALSAFAYSGALYLIAVLARLILKKEAMGGGDIKLAFFLGLLLGPEATLLSALLSFILAALILLALQAASKVRYGQEVPFVPFMALAASLSLLYGTEILIFYRNMIL